MITNETKTATCELCGGTGLRGGAGEQRCSCGAVPPSSHILDLLDQYWNIAYQQGVEGRTTDNEAGDASQILSEIMSALASPAPLPVAVKASEIDELIEELLDAQQDINLAANTTMSQPLCDASALIDKTETFLRRIRSALSSPVGRTEEKLTDDHLKTTVEICRSTAEDMIKDNIQWRLDPRYILRLCDAVSLSSTPASDIAAMREALAEAEPYVEICHSLITQKETRANVWRVLKQVRSALQHVAKGERG